MRTTTTTTRPAGTARRSLAALALAATSAVALSACSFSASTGGSDYAGEELAGTVTETLAGEYPESVFEDMSCADTPTIAAGETTACHGVVDGAAMDFTVSWQDEDGNFSVDAVAA